MSKRIARDVTPSLEEGDQKYVTQINSKKRKFNEIFSRGEGPARDLNSSSESNGSSSATNSRKRRLLNEVK
jgi:hypothetical protein